MYMRGISAERRFPDKMCTGNVWRETSCPGIVQSGKRHVRETSVYRTTNTTLDLKPALTKLVGRRSAVATNLRTRQRAEDGNYNQQRATAKTPARQTLNAAVSTLVRWRTDYLPCRRGPGAAS